MTVGNPTASSQPHVGLRYQCLQGQNRGAEMPDFPTKACSGGIFVTQHFPASVLYLPSAVCILIQFTSQMLGRR
jgi:hypothetical protein